MRPLCGLRVANAAHKVSLVKARGERSFANVLGPGLLFAGAAVGVSHLVQATYAGAVYGLSLLGVIVMANVLKYPAFSFGPRFAAATGTSLLEGYRRQGAWALVVFALVTVATMFTVEAAVTLVTAALVKALFGLETSLLVVSIVLLIASALICAVGKFSLLDRVVKAVVITLTVATVVATALAIPHIDFGLPLVPSLSMSDRAQLLWLAALIGWMPTAIDISVWHSLWTLAKVRQTGYRAEVRESLLDFKVGYWGTAFLAICFALLGAGIIYGSGGKVPSGAVPFANMILDLYGSTLGSWARLLIGGCAALVMFSTTLTVVDGFPRALTVLARRFQTTEEPGAEVDLERRPFYWGSVLVLGIGSALILRFYLKDLRELVNIATTLSFLTAPVLAFLNHRAITSDVVPTAHRPGPKMVGFSLFSIAVLAAFACFYVYLKV